MKFFHSRPVILSSGARKNHLETSNNPKHGLHQHLNPRYKCVLELLRGFQWEVKVEPTLQCDSWTCHITSLGRLLELQNIYVQL